MYDTWLLLMPTDVERPFNRVLAPNDRKQFTAGVITQLPPRRLSYRPLPCAPAYPAGARGGNRVRVSERVAKGCRTAFWIDFHDDTALLTAGR